MGSSDLLADGSNWPRGSDMKRGYGEAQDLSEVGLMLCEFMILSPEMGTAYDSAMLEF